MIKKIDDFNSDELYNNEIKLKIIVGDNESYWTTVSRFDLEKLAEKFCY